MSYRPSSWSAGGTQLRRATLGDAHVLGTLRAQMRAEGSAQARDAIEAFERSCAAYFTREFSRAEPNVRAWVACDSEHVVATAVLMILPTL
ncbi:MAG: hypothetical protein GIX03_09120, partial [Candidatus Eremiobacteraeota bacterium]|nr:hypothetical protein [Candidatus Eremiobacteraeota bacterium]